MIYAILIVSLIVTVIIRTNICVKITTKASINLHNRMFNSILRTTMFFFNTNSTGIIFVIYVFVFVFFVFYVVYILLYKIYNFMLCYAGQILNRFSTDMGAIDKILPNTFMDFIQVTIFILLKY